MATVIKFAAELRELFLDASCGVVIAKHPAQRPASLVQGNRLSV